MLHFFLTHDNFYTKEHFCVIVFSTMILKNNKGF